MGYSTEFKGELKFNRELTASQLAKVKSFLGEDCRDHPEWINGVGLYHVDLEFNDDFSGLKWDESEKTYGMVDLINMIIANMVLLYPDFGLNGRLTAQGESIDDRYDVIMEDEVAVKKDITPSRTKIKCPCCEEEFYY